MAKDEHENLRERAKNNFITSRELSELAHVLEEPVDETDKFEIIWALGKVRAVKYAHLIEQFLEGPDPELAGLALRVLCTDWGMTSRYTDVVLQLMRGVDWDIDETCQRPAISIAGAYLKDTFHLEFLRELIRIFEDETDDVRTYAYYALCEATGYELNRLPFTYNDFDPSTMIDPIVIQTAKERLINEVR